MYTLVNGEAAEDISTSDRGLNYGDGCFTTIAVAHGEMQLWSRHWQRLENTCLKIGISVPKENVLSSEAQKLIEKHGKSTAVIKIVITRGSGGRGYSPELDSTPSRIITLSEMPEHYTVWREEGISLVNASFRLAIQPELAGLKTLNRLEQVLLKQQLQKLQEVTQPAPDDMIVCDANGYICEATMGNIFWRKGTEWFTPQLTEAGIAGVVREELLSVNPHVRLGHYLPENLQQAEEMFVCNSLLGLVPVSNINGLELPVRVYSDAWQTRL